MAYRQLGECEGDSQLKTTFIRVAVRKHATFSFGDVLTCSVHILVMYFIAHENGFLSISGGANLFLK